jgi:hypothetical protein
MGILRLASDATTKIDMGDGDFIEVRTDVSKRTFNAILAAMPDVPDGETISLSQSLDFAANLFEVFVVGWSLDVPCTKESYFDLSREAADAIDLAVAKHFEGLTPNKDEATKSP